MDYEISADDYFAIIPEKVLYADISHIAVRIYGVLRRHADQTGSCYPGRARIAKLAHTSSSSVDRAIQELVEHRFITVHHRRNPDNPQHMLSNRYVIHSTPPAHDHTPTVGDDTPLPLVGTPPPASDEVTIAIEPEPINHFEQWWKTYPKRVNRKAAQKAWKTAIKTTSPQAIIEATRQQIATTGSPLSREHIYIPMPSSWLNAGSHLDQYGTTEPVRPYDQPARPQCDTCDNTGYISTEDEKGRWHATPCTKCSATI